MKPSPKPPTSFSTDNPSTDLAEQIRARAYDLYELRGRQDGHDFDDWLQAEAELTSQSSKAVAA